MGGIHLCSAHTRLTTCSSEAFHMHWPTDQHPLYYGGTCTLSAAADCNRLRLNRQPQTCLQSLDHWLNCQTAHSPPLDTVSVTCGNLPKSYASTQHLNCQAQTDRTQNHSPHQLRHLNSAITTLWDRCWAEVTRLLKAPCLDGILNVHWQLWCSGIPNNAMNRVYSTLHVKHYTHTILYEQGPGNTPTNTVYDKQATSRGALWWADTHGSKYVAA